jgi:hypothetical protein
MYWLKTYPIHSLQKFCVTHYKNDKNQPESRIQKETTNRLHRCKVFILKKAETREQRLTLHSTCHVSQKQKTLSLEFHILLFTLSSSSVSQSLSFNLLQSLYCPLSSVLALSSNKGMVFFSSFHFLRLRVFCFWLTWHVEWSVSLCSLVSAFFRMKTLHRWSRLVVSREYN